MADIVISTPTAGLGGIEMKAAGLIAVATAHTEVEVRSKCFAIQMDWTACEIASNDEFYLIAVEAQNGATWTRIGVLNALGATEITGEGDATATGSTRAAFSNPYGDTGKVRLKTWCTGTIATGINYSAKLYPIDSLGIPG